MSTGHVGVNYISAHKAPLANVAQARGTAARPDLSVKNCSPPGNERLPAASLSCFLERLETSLQFRTLERRIPVP